MFFVSSYLYSCLDTQCRACRRCSPNIYIQYVITIKIFKNLELDELSWIIYIKKLFLDPTCKPEIVDSRATFNLRLSEYYKCMLTKVVNSQTGRTVYYQHVVLEYKDQMAAKQNIMIKCDMGMTPNNNSSYDSEVEQVSLVKRQADFENFREE